MRLSLLRVIDQWAGGFLLYLLVWPTRMVEIFAPPHPEPKPRYVFLKLKGGGSLMIAMPALLGLRRKYPGVEFVLVCAREAKIYADLTGVFDRMVIIDDASLFSLLISGLRAMRDCFRVDLCIDLEPNSLLAAVFTMLSCAGQRIGLVKPEHPARAYAYTDALSFNAISPIYIYYDRICEILKGTPASAPECRAAIQSLLPPPALIKNQTKTIGVAAFTSDFARERMMPPETWARLLYKKYSETPLRLLIFGSARNTEAAINLAQTLRDRMPAVEIINLANTGTLAQAAAQLLQCDDIWAVDSGLLHIARLLGLTSHSFWGPTMPTQRLRPIEGLVEEIVYRPFLCSPCIQASIVPPCGGQNLCMISMAEESPDLQPSWVKRQ